VRLSDAHLQEERASRPESSSERERESRARRADSRCPFHYQKSGAAAVKNFATAFLAERGGGGNEMPVKKAVTPNNGNATTTMITVVIVEEREGRNAKQA
jgi:hypothetical protein